MTSSPKKSLKVKVSKVASEDGETEGILVSFNDGEFEFAGPKETIRAVAMLILQHCCDS